MGENLGWEMGALWVYDRENDDLSRVSMWKSEELREARYQHVEEDTEYRSGQGIIFRTVSSGHTEWIDNLEKTEVQDSTRVRMGQELGFRSALFLPLNSPGGAVGMIELFSRSYKPSDDDELVAMHLLAAQVGSTVTYERSGSGVSRS